MPDEKIAREDQREETDEETVGRNRHGTMDAPGAPDTKGSNYENNGPADGQGGAPASRESANDAEGLADPNLSADQDTTTGRM